MKPSDVRLRDWFAGLAMTQILDSSDTRPDQIEATLRQVAKASFKVANAMMAERANLPVPGHDRPITDLNLPTNAARALENGDVKTVGQLLRLTRAELLRMPNFGARALRAVERALDAVGLEIGEGAPP